MRIRRKKAEKALNIYEPTGSFVEPFGSGTGVSVNSDSVQIAREKFLCNVLSKTGRKELTTCMNTRKVLTCNSCLRCTRGCKLYDKHVGEASDELEVVSCGKLEIQ